MRIWIINHYAYAPFHSAGTRHHSLARELIGRGHDVRVVSTSFFHKTRKETRLNPGQVFLAEDVDGVPFVWLRTPPYEGNGGRRAWNMIVFAWRVLRLVGLRDESKPDIIIGSSPSLLAAVAARLLARRMRVPFVSEVRDLWPDMLVMISDISERHPFILAHAWLEKYLYRHSDAIISVMPGAGPRMQTKGADPTRIHVLPNGADISRIPHASRPEVRDPLTFMYAGAHGPAQALETILEAARIVQDEPWGPRVRFELVGEGSVKKDLERHAAKLGLRNVTFCPPVPKSEIYAKLATADAFILTLKDSPIFQWGISPNKLFDYLATGRPTIFAVNTPFNAVAESGGGITVAAEDPVAMTDAVKRIADASPDERWAMGTRARSHVEQHYDTRQQARTLEHILLELVARNRGTLQSQDQV